MNNKDHFIEKQTDLYEEVLTSESLDQYEGLLNHYMNKNIDLKRPYKKKKK